MGTNTGSGGLPPLPGAAGSTGKAPDLTCPVCGTVNPASRQFCRKCASDLRAPVLPDGAPVPPPPEPVPLRPILVGGGIAAALLALLVIVLLVLNGQPSVSASPSPSVAPTPTAAPSPVPSVAITEPPVTPPPATPGPSATLGPPRIRSFTGPESVNCSSPDFTGTIHLTWRVQNATGVSIAIDGPGIYERYTDLEGEADVPFGCGGITHSYLLTTVGGNGPDAVRQLFVESAG